MISLISRFTKEFNFVFPFGVLYLRVTTELMTREKKQKAQGSMITIVATLERKKC